MDLVRGACLGAAAGVGVAVVARAYGGSREEREVGVATQHLHRTPTLARHMARFRVLGDASPEARANYEALVDAADAFAGLTVDFRRASQFKCNRLIAEMGTLARNACRLAPGAEADYLHDQGLAELDALCTDTLHNLTLELR